MLAHVLSLILAGLGATGQATDFALSEHRNDWLHHPVYGDPSFDGFERIPGNPIYRGSPPYEWPVNGFFFEDPKSGDWFLYIGLYAKGYAMTNDLSMRCVVYRSKDHGVHWEPLGCPFPEESFRFDADTSPVGHAPDVSVLYADGRYHMIYDWATADTRWETAANPPLPSDSGVGYAWSERPEGPFIRTSPAVYRTGKSPMRMGKYRRGYAASIVKRDQDWMVLFMMDSGPSFGWALFGTTAPKPEGPYSEPFPLRTVESDYFHPPLMEFFPAFQHDGYVYAPATSVALNRDFQGIFRAPTEQAHRQEAWELWQCGSVWHSEAVPNEYYGIWGQTFTGFVNKAGSFNVMFPSRDPEGIGAINLARRPWNQPCREQGFVFSGHQGPALTLLKQTRTAFELETKVKYGGEVSILWGYHAPLGPNKPTADATLHPLSLTRHFALRLTADTWRITKTGDASTTEEIASDRLAVPVDEIALRIASDGTVTLGFNNTREWEGHLDAIPGAVGLLVSPHSRLEVFKFILAGDSAPGLTGYLHTEAILGAGAAHEAWQQVDAAEFHCGTGAVSLKPGARAKWNVEGARFELWAPTGPNYGTGTLFVDGAKQGPIDFHTDKTQESRVIWTSAALPNARHAVVLVSDDSPIPLDMLAATSSSN